MEQPSKRLPIKLEIYASYNLGDKSVGEARQIEIKAAKCAFMAKGLFLMMGKVCFDAVFSNPANDEDTLPETLVLGPAQTAELGAALINACTDYIDQMEVAVENEKTAGGR